MKGFAEFLVVAFFLVICVFVILAMFIHSIRTRASWGPGSMDYYTEFANTAVRPYIIASALTHFKINDGIDDKLLTELSLESIIVRQTDPNIEAPLTDFMDMYEIDYVVILEEEGLEPLLSIGEREEGFVDAFIPLLYKGRLGYLIIGTG